MNATQIFDQLKAQFADAILETVEGKLPVVRVAAAQLPDVAAHLKESPGLDFDLLSCITAVDYGEQFEVVYHLRSLKEGHTIVLKIRLDRQDPVAPSLVALWRSARLQEREIYDFFGIRFAGHPNLRRLFLWEEFPGYPLRKDFEYTTTVRYSEPEDQGQALNL